MALASGPSGPARLRDSSPVFWTLSLPPRAVNSPSGSASFSSRPLVLGCSAMLGLLDRREDNQGRGGLVPAVGAETVGFDGHGGQGVAGRGAGGDDLGAGLGLDLAGRAA